MKNKKGISDVVTTVLIILLVVAAVAIIWSFVQRPLQQGGIALQTGADCLQIAVIPTACSNYKVAGVNDSANAVYKLTSGTAILSSVKVIYQKSDGTTVIVTGAAPSGVGSTAKVNYTVFGAEVNGASSIGVAAVVKGSDGADVTCAESLEKVACK